MQEQNGFLLLQCETKKCPLTQQGNDVGKLFEQNKKVCSLQEHPGSVCTASSGARPFTEIYPLSNENVFPRLEIRKKWI